MYHPQHVDTGLISVSADIFGSIISIVMEVNIQYPDSRVDCSYQIPHEPKVADSLFNTNNTHHQSATTSSFHER